VNNFKTFTYFKHHFMCAENIMQDRTIHNFYSLPQLCPSCSKLTSNINTIVLILWWYKFVHNHVIIRVYLLHKLIRCLFLFWGRLVCFYYFSNIYSCFVIYTQWLVISACYVIVLATVQHL
jgi:hypothetical protein